MLFVDMLHMMSQKIISDAHLFLSIICSCIIRSLAGGMYAPPGGEQHPQSAEK